MWTIVLYIMYALLSLPLVLCVLAILALIWGGRESSRMISRASKFPCPKCGVALGRTAVLAGANKFAQQVHELQKRYPGVRFRIVAEWVIDCDACGLTVYFDPVSETFEIVARRQFQLDAFAKADEQSIKAADS